ncbi:uncharacterized protein LOC143032905 isoform X6 [Oratosquilla oratoria]|uniref:uncharacterized protein LOC143032905 isoform X6 n=1 Tax=Oratosquilla oratoria TaxID=337810 RepID=UPI003F76C462
MADTSKYVRLKRSETCGFGFSILGGAGSELPPIIYDIIEGSPAANSSQLAPGDIICEVNGQEVITFTTKEVLNCLRLSSNEVTLKLKTDAGIQERVRQYLATPPNMAALRSAITHDDLQGVKQIVAKKQGGKSPTKSPAKSTASSPAKSATSSPAKTPVSPARSDRSEPLSERSDCDSSRVSDGVEDSTSFDDRTAHENERNKQKKQKSEAYLMTEEEVRGATIKTANSTTAATSPPLSEDESDIESLHSFHYSPKAVDLPSAIRLAKRLYNLEGFKKSDVSRHLSKNNEFSRVVAEEYLHYFDFTGDTLDIALRKFLDKFCLAGETQERERVLVHFSRRFLECNPGTFNSQDAVHTLTCALMLLNTDLHGQNVGRKMTCGEFIENLSELNDGENFPREVLKSLYQAMRTQPLHWATDDDSENAKGAPGKSSSDSSSHVVGSNPFLEPPAGSGVDYKKGYIMRKCCTDPNGKRTAFGKRSWKMFYCVVQDLVLYLHKDEQGARRGPQYQLGHNAIRLHHALATRATDYNKKEHVFRLETADQAEYLLQTSDSKELQAWIDTINYVAASLSAPPLPGAVGSQKKFQRPLLPCSITKLNLREQMEDHIKRLAQLEADLEDHKAHPPEKNAKSATISNYKEKEAHLICEVKRYHTYVYLLRSKVSLQPSLDSGELPVFEAPPGLADSDEHMEDRGGQRIIPPPIPERSRPSESPDPPPKSPLAVRKQLEIAQDEDEGNDINTVSGNGKYCETLNPFFDGDDELEPESEASENKEKENKLKVKEEKERKKLEKKERKEEEKRVKTLERKEKKDREKEKKEKEREKKEKERQEQEEKATKEKEKQKSNSQEDDPQLGTLNRLSAIFKFNKLNSRKEDEEILNDKLELQKDDDDEAPPLPPKPSPNSPIMKNIGTRIDI